MGRSKKSAECLAAAFDAAVEFRIGFGKCADFQIRAAQVETADPGIEEAIGVGEELDRLRGRRPP